MAFDERLAERVRYVLARVRGRERAKHVRRGCVPDRRSYVCGTVGDDLVLRLGKAGANAALDRPHVRPMDFTGRPMRSMVFVAPAGIATHRALKRWVEHALEYTRTLPPKS